jgi:hypothetical protein
VFYLQARQEDRLMSLKLEKEQVLFLAGGLTEVMADLAAPAEVPAESELELEQPVQAEWAVGSMQLAYDSVADRVLLVAREAAEDEDDPEAAGPGTSGPRTIGPSTSGPGTSGPGTSGPGTSGRDDREPDDTEPGGGGGPGGFGVSAGWAALEDDEPHSGATAVARLGEDHSCPKTNGHRAPAL